MAAVVEALPMDILMVSAELSPLARSTQTGDVVAGLSKALKQQGHEVTVALPRYPSFDASGLLLARRLNPLVLPNGREVTLFDGQLPSGVQLVLFDAPDLFERHEISDPDGKEWPGHAARFAFLALCGARLTGYRREQGRPFEVVHAHDWPLGLLPSALAVAEGPRMPSVLTLYGGAHSGRYQARSFSEFAPHVGLDQTASTQEPGVSFLEMGIRAADCLATLSVSLTDTVRSGKGVGSASALPPLDKPIVAIPPGLDYAVYNPATDPSLASRYDAEDSDNKGRCKGALLRELDLELDITRPLVVVFGLPGRNAGSQALSSMLERLLRNQLKLVVTGAAEDTRAAELTEMAAKHPESFAWLPVSEDAGLRRLVAAADIAVIASDAPPLFSMELVAQRYGAVPVALRTGSSIDAIVDCDPELETGTGFLFDGDSDVALLGAVQRAITAYQSPGWGRLRRRILKLDVGWDRPARRYAQLYRQARARAVG